MSVAEDITEGIVCEECHSYLLGKGEELACVGYPIRCQDCFDELTNNEKRYFAQFWNEETGEVETFSS